MNESDSGSALESVVQSQQDCDVALNPTVQKTAILRIESQGKVLEMRMTDSKDFLQFAVQAIELAFDV